MDDTERVTVGEIDGEFETLMVPVPETVTLAERDRVFVTVALLLLEGDAVVDGHDEMV